MAGEVTIARERTPRSVNSVRTAPRGRRLNYEDDVVTVYDDKGNVDYRGIHDYSPYKDDKMTWDDKAKNYKLQHGYRLVVG